MSEANRRSLQGATADQEQPASNRFSPLYREVRQTIGKTVRSVFTTAFARSASREYFTIYFDDGSSLQIKSRGRITATFSKKPTSTP